MHKKYFYERVKDERVRGSKRKRKGRSIEVEKRQQWTSSVNKLLEKQQQELIKQKNLNTKDLKETYDEKQESSGALNSLGGWRHQWL